MAIKYFQKQIQNLPEGIIKNLFPKGKSWSGVLGGLEIW